MEERQTGKQHIVGAVPEMLNEVSTNSVSLRMWTDDAF